MVARPLSLWLDRLYGFVRDDDTDRAIDLIFETTDRMGQQRDNADFDALLRAIDVDRLNLACLVALSEIGQHLAYESGAWQRFAAAARPRLKALSSIP